MANAMNATAKIASPDENMSQPTSHRAGQLGPQAQRQGRGADAGQHHQKQVLAAVGEQARE